MRGGLLQRSVELDALARQLARIRAGAGRVIVVEGPAGVGKTSLVRAAAQSADGAGVRVLRAWAGPLEQQAGWGVVRQLFGSTAAGPEWEYLGVDAAALARRALGPEPFAAAPTGDAVHAASYGLSWLAYGLAERAPTLLVVDDVHWADVPSLRWLAQLSRHLGELRLGVLCAVRSGEPATEPAALADLLAAAPEPPVRPRPLGPDAVETLVTARLPGADPEFVAASHAASAGNPFLLGALVDQVIAEGVEPSAEVAARLTTFGPEQVGRSVEVQLARRPAGTRELACAFAVLGRGALLRQAAQVAGLDVVGAHRLADGLVASGLLGRADDGFALTHPLVANALYLGLPDGERSLLHRRAATILAGERADVEAVGLHLLRAQPAGEPETVSTLRAAAERASRRGAPESAAVFLRRALLEPPGSRALTADLHSELGLCLAAQVRPGAAGLLADAVELAATPEQRVRIALSGSRALGMAGHFDRAIELCRLGLGQPVDAGARLLGSLELEMACGMLLTADTVEEGLDLARKHALLDDEVLWRVVAAWGLLNECRPAVEASRLLLPALDAVTPPRNAESLVSTFAKFLLIANGELDTARRLCDALVELARPQGWLIALAHGSFMRAIALIRLGRIHEARADARLSFDFKRDNSPPAALVWSLFPLVEALTEMNELDAAEDALDTGHRLGDPPPACVSGTLLLERRAHLRLAQRRYDEAHADLVRAADWWRRLRVAHPGIAGWRVDDCEALVALGDSATARTLALEQLELAERTGLPEARGAALRALAHTAVPADAVGLLERAVGLLAPSPARLEHTRALVDLGSALRRINRRAAAGDPLRRGLDLAERGGMLRLADRARSELLACGARPRRSAITGIESLTPAERQVADLAAAGHGNREIAQRLYVTRRTVETHLTHVFAKLGISGRSDLVHLFADAAPTVHRP
ncbi:MAG TPA: AAA family ATPase [Mycobacteriales bacterium]|nr:AAA family ATPase [Mycobacteriales bacterium]